MSLEAVRQCPACGAASAQPLHIDVPDFVFHATDERWTLLRCAECTSLWLSERPSRASIGSYYRRYYTHGAASGAMPISGISIGSSALRRLANSWRNFRYGTRRPSFGTAGVALMLLIPPLRRWIDAECRHLPPVRERRDGYSVLDIGCGDARFVRFATEAGCRAAGVDVDSVAVEAARLDKLDVRHADAESALELFGPGSFDLVTMSHVIEHLYEPRRTLRTVHDLLRPGGKLWLETPNPNAYGHELYGDRWRDLDPPRHICLLSLRALRDAAGAAGLELKTEHHRPFVPFEVYPFSATARALAAQRRPSPSRARLTCLAYELMGRIRPERREWLTLTFGRPDKSN